MCVVCSRLYVEIERIWAINDSLVFNSVYCLVDTTPNHLQTLIQLNAEDK